MSNISEELLIDQLSLPKNRITSSEIIKFYNQYKIEFPQNKDGTPNMSYSQNKNTYKMLYRKKIKANVKKRKRSIDSVDRYLESKDNKKEECVICFEPIEQDVVILRCNHIYCVSCSIKHFRTKTTCPLCQCEIVEENTNINRREIPERFVNEIINDEIDFMTMNSENKDILSVIYLFLERVFNRGYMNISIFNYLEIEQMTQNIASRIIDWYQ